MDYKEDALRFGGGGGGKQFIYELQALGDKIGL
jgi:hypothetical protein